MRIEPTDLDECSITNSDVSTDKKGPAMLRGREGKSPLFQSCQLLRS